MNIDDRLRRGLRPTGGVDLTDLDDDLQRAVARGRRHQLARRAAFGGATMAGVIGLAVASIAFTTDGGPDRVVTTPGDRAAPRVEWTPSTAAPGPTTTTSTTMRAPGPARPDNTGDFVNGRQIVDITAVNADRRTVTFDAFLWFSGEEADQAMLEDGDKPDRGDYYTRNVNSRLRTLPISRDVAITLAGGEPGTWEEFLERATHEDGEGDTFSRLPFWLTIRRGVVVEIEQQYHP